MRLPGRAINRSQSASTKIVLGTVIKRRVDVRSIMHIRRRVVKVRTNGEGYRLTKGAYTMTDHVEDFACYTARFPIRSILARILHPRSRRKDAPKTFGLKQVKISTTQRIVLMEVFNVRLQVD